MKIMVKSKIKYSTDDGRQKAKRSKCNIWTQKEVTQVNNMEYESS